MDFESRVQRVKTLISEFPDFPKKGVIFRDIFSVLRNPEVFEDLIKLLVEHVQSKHGKVDVVVGLESRGFLFAPMMAIKLGASFVPLRKKGKLPGDLARVEYSLEYGTDIMEAQKDSIQAGQKTIIVDDLLATGGTMMAASQLLHQMNADILECLVVIELDALNGRDKLKDPVYSLIHY